MITWPVGYSLPRASSGDGDHPDAASSAHQWRTLHLHQRSLEAVSQEGGVHKHKYKLYVSTTSSHLYVSTIKPFPLFFLSFAGFLSQRQFQQSSAAGSHFQTGNFSSHWTQLFFLFLFFFFLLSAYLSSISPANNTKIIERFILIISNNSSSFLSPCPPDSKWHFVGGVCSHHPGWKAENESSFW